MFKRLRQLFCKHYYIMDKYGSGRNNYVFRCARCDQRLELRAVFLTGSYENTIIELSKLESRYLKLIAKYEPENLAKEAKKYESKIVIKKEGKSAEATKLMAIMGMGVKCGNVVDVEIEGADEEKAYEDIKAFFEANL